MEKRKVGLSIFWIGVLYIIIMGFITSYWVRGALARPFQKAFEGSTPGSPVAIMVFLVLGWLFLFISHYQSIRLEKGKNT